MTSKSKLNLYCQKAHILVPCYTTERVPDGFVCTVTVDGKSYSSRMPHSTKKMAEDDAARAAVEVVVQAHSPASDIDEIIEWLDQQSSKKRSYRQPFQPPAFASSRRQGGGQQHAPPRISQPVSSISPKPEPQSQVSDDTTQSPPAHLQSFWDGPMRNLGKPASASPLPAPISVISTSGPATGRAVPTDRGSVTQVAYQDSLEGYCRSQGLPDPTYHVRSVRDRFSASVTVDDQEFSTQREYGTFDEAKESATRLACLALGIETGKNY